ncbi:MAG: hypothetical protein ABR499_22075 [Gemmatimonadaceae bacterium]
MPYTVAMREFTDSAGLGWRVWPTTPRVGSVYDQSLRSGWLTFESATGSRRRLAPIPRGWEDATRERLELMCRAAEAVQRTGTTPDPDAPDALEGPLGSGEPPPPER